MKQFTLDNGMQIIVIEDHRSPVVNHSVWYKAGAGDEVAGKTGIAHMLEHMMFKGTPKFPSDQFDKAVTYNGGQYNAMTSRDWTAYYEKIGADKLEMMMELEADRMANLNINDELFQPERDVVMEERRWRFDSKPAPKFFEHVNHKFYGDHPYGHMAIGWKEDIEGYTVEDAIAWYKTHYAPNNALLLVVGDVKANEVHKLAQKYYGVLKPVTVPDHTWPQIKLLNAPQRMSKVDSALEVPILYQATIAPSNFDNGGFDLTAKQRSRDSLALSIMAEIFGGGQTGWLYEQLVKKQQLADSASSSYDDVSRGPGEIEIYVQPKTGVTLDKLEQAVAAQIKLLQANGVTEDELQSVKTQMIADDVYARDDIWHVAYRMGTWVISGGKAEEYNSWMDEIKTITPDDIKRVANKYLITDRMLTAGLVQNAQQLGEWKE